MGGQTAGLNNVHDIVVVAGTSASEAARGGGLKAQASVKHRLRTAAGLPRTARTAGVCLGPSPSLQCYGASAGIRVVLAGPQTQLAGPQTQCHDASAADSSRARDTAPRDGNERDDTNERDLAGVVAGGSQPRDRRARREVAHPRTAERHYDDR